ncbi:MAG: hypothetical protein IJW13_01145 [Clostridia bacterium]|nr:hypothetical protein [Clostridia bacterium]
MQAINLYLLSSFSNMRLYGKYYGALAHTQARPYKPHEAKSLISLVNKMMEQGALLSELDGFFYGYIIPQIGKEFDILKIGQNAILNVELKSYISKTEDAHEQLIKNKFYLSHLGKKCYFFTYNSFDQKLYKLNAKGEFERAYFSELLRINRGIRGAITAPIDSLFAAKQFILAPVKNPERFILGEYFLTQQQQMIKKKTASFLKGKNKALKICGSFGTGKTLLLLDMAVLVCSNKKTLIVVYGSLTEGHRQIERAFTNIKFLSVNDIFKANLSEYDYIFTDETQKYSKKAFDAILQYLNNNEIKCVFCFEKFELDLINEPTELNARLAQIEGNTYYLSGNIRVNEQISCFIKYLLDNGKAAKKSGYNCVNVHFAQNEEQKLNFINLYSAGGFEIIDCAYLNEEARAGIEYDKMLIVIDGNYGYDGRGYLTYRGKFPQRLYYSLTRVREQLTVVVVNNMPIFERLLNGKIKK